jgi:hypothetical protein
LAPRVKQGHEQTYERIEPTQHLQQIHLFLTTWKRL